MILNSHKIGIIILSRFNSSRLPGKALIEFEGKPLLSRIIERLTAVFDKDDIIIGTSSEPSDDPIAQLGLTEGVKVFRGDLQNVAQRFFNAASSVKLDYAVRITGDSLFIDPIIAQKLLATLQAGDFDLISNRTDTFPIGQSIEVVNMNTMAKFITSFSAPDDQEHVTQFFYKNETTLRLKISRHVNEEGKFRDVSLAIDTPMDLETARAVVKDVGVRFRTIGYKEIYDRYMSIQKPHLSH